MGKTVADALDQLDLSLVRELEIDARQSYLDLAAKLGTTSMTVSRRLQRLLDERIVTVVAMADPLVLGYTMQANMWINVLPGQAEVVADRLASLPNVQFIVLTTGRYDMVVTTVFRDLEEMLKLISEELGGITEVIHSETMLILRQVKNSWACLGTAWDAVKPKPRDWRLDDLDRLLIAELERAPRQTVTEIAKKLDINRSSVGRKLQALLDEGVVRVACMPNLAALGFSILPVTLVKIWPGKIQAVADAVARYEQVRHVHVGAGRYDLTIWTAFRDVAEVHRFIADISIIPEVLSHETLMSSKMVKTSWALSS